MKKLISSILLAVGILGFALNPASASELPQLGEGCPNSGGCGGKDKDKDKDHDKEDKEASVFNLSCGDKSCDKDKKKDKDKHDDDHDDKHDDKHDH